MDNARVINKASLQGKAKCYLCGQTEKFHCQDPLLHLSVHAICLELLAYNLPEKTGKILMKAVRQRK
jgi:hypothetical protein